MIFNIQKFLIQNKIEYRASGKNVGSGNINICCLYCAEGRFHLSISLKKDVFVCWICGEKGNYEKLISKIKNISYLEAKSIINPQNDLKKVLEERSNKMTPIIKEPIKNKNFKLPSHTYPFRINKTDIWEETALKFLRDKYALTKKEIVEADLHYCVHGKYQNCIIIPIYLDKKLVNFVARYWIKNSKIRYKNCSNDESLVKTKNLIYNKDNIKIGQNLIITEGVFDCIKVKSIFTNVISTFGTEISKEQCRLITSLKPPKTLFLVDNDIGNPNTVKKAKELCDYLSIFMRAKYIEVPYKGKDPADLTKQEIANLIKLW